MAFEITLYKAAGDFTTMMAAEYSFSGGVLQFVSIGDVHKYIYHGDFLIREVPEEKTPPEAEVLLAWPEHSN